MFIKDGRLRTFGIVIIGFWSGRVPWLRLICTLPRCSVLTWFNFMDEGLKLVLVLLRFKELAWISFCLFNLFQYYFIDWWLCVEIEHHFYGVFQILTNFMKCNVHFFIVIISCYCNTNLTDNKRFKTARLHRLIVLDTLIEIYISDFLFSFPNN